ncbi:MAG TPA: prepilin peptidase [Actinobacteria bacterium]|nr:prepilin peptidase [Actinomycetota bacterium]
MVVLLVVLALLGLAVGSFLTVVAARVPEGESIVSPRSRCRTCGTAVGVRDNVPVVSWILLRGRCRACGAPIGIRYPIVELLTAALFAAAGVVVGPRAVLPAYLWFVGVTLVLAVVDLERKLIPNRILYPGTVVGVVLLGVGAFLDGEPARLPGALGAGLGTFLALGAVWLAARGGFGFGDVKLGFLLGVFVGYGHWSHAVAAFVLAFLLGGVVSVLLLVTGIRGRKDAIPFGPYLVAGAYLAIVYGDEIVRWYLGA